MELITTYHQFLILGSIEACDWLCGFLHVSAIQLVLQSIFITVYVYCIPILVNMFLCVLLVLGCNLVGPVNVLLTAVFMQLFYEQIKMMMMMTLQPGHLILRFPVLHFQLTN